MYVCLFVETNTPLVTYACFELNLCILNIGFIVIVVVRGLNLFEIRPGCENVGFNH